MIWIDKRLIGDWYREERNRDRKTLKKIIIEVAKERRAVKEKRLRREEGWGREKWLRREEVGLEKRVV